ncbi:hypothetical protein V2I01_43320 [Micromonospora sp. BRA006-A]|nr:hypothetical protein [Micromonospora sp. BRA006-A]
MAVRTASMLVLLPFMLSNLAVWMRHRWTATACSAGCAACWPGR